LFFLNQLITLFTMKFAATTLIVLALLGNGAHARTQGVRGGQLTRRLQDNGGNVLCVSITGSDGVKRTVLPCTTPAPSTTVAADGENRAGGAKKAGGGAKGGMM
jgi:hypothetical protein